MTTFLNLSENINCLYLRVESDDPNWYLTGLADADGSFEISLPSPNEQRFAPNFVFLITSADQSLIKYLNETYDPSNELSKMYSNTRVQTGRPVFKAGTRVENSFKIRRNESINSFVIPHFIQYPLQTYKSIDFLLFRKAFDLYRADPQVNGKTSEKTLVLVACCAYAMNSKGNYRPYPTLEAYCEAKGLDFERFNNEVNALHNSFLLLKKNYEKFYATFSNLSYAPCYSYFVGMTQGDGGLSASLGNRFRWEMNINDAGPTVIQRCVATLQSKAATVPKKGANSYVANITFGEKRLGFLLNVVFATVRWQGEKAKVLDFAEQYVEIMFTTVRGSYARTVALEELKSRILAYRAQNDINV